MASKQAVEAKPQETEAKPDINNLVIWDQVEQTDPAFTKQYKGNGGFQGTATNVTYLVKKATSTFGLLGIGWGYEILGEEMVQGATTLDKAGERGTEIIHKLHLKFWYIWDGKRGEFTHFGQTTFVGKNKYGWFTDEEAPKKSLTDALSKCLSMLGFASDIHMGLYDDSKYVRDLRRDFDDRDEFDRRPRASEHQDNRPDSGQSQKPKDTSSKPAAQSSTKASSPPAGDDMTDEELVDDLKKALDEKETANEVVDFMSDPDVVKDLKTLPKEMEEEVRAYGRSILGEKFNFAGAKARKGK